MVAIGHRSFRVRKLKQQAGLFIKAKDDLLLVNP
jgi:hypothetical protein